MSIQRRAWQANGVCYDLVFYTPWIGSILSTEKALPPGGAERQILMLATELARRGQRVALIVFGRPQTLPTTVEGVEIVPRTAYRTSPGAIDKLVEVLLIWRSLWCTPSATIVFRGAGTELGVIGLFTRLTRRRFVYSSANIADFEPRKLIPNRAYALIHDLGIRLSDQIVVQTEEQARICEAKFGRRPMLIKSLAGLAEPQKSAPEAFLWVGRLTSYKRPLQYLALARALPEARFWMVGVPTPHHEGDLALIDEVRAGVDGIPNLELLSPRSHAAIGELMSRAVAAVNTADFEGMSNVLLEAWSRGVPALVLTHDPDDVVAAYQLGGFAGGSFQRFVALGREQWATRQNREALAQRCRDYISANHAPAIVADQWLSALPPQTATGGSGGQIPSR